MSPILWTLVAGTIALIWFWRKHKEGSHKNKLMRLGLKELPGPKERQKYLGRFSNKQFTKWAEEFGDIYKVNTVGGQINIVVSDPKLAKEILSVEPSFTGRQSLHLLETYEEYPHLGIVTAVGERWEVHRRFLLRQLRDFGFGKSSMQALIMEELGEVIKTYKKSVGKPVGEIRDTLRLSVVNSLWAILTSQRFRQDDPDLMRLANNTSKTFNELMSKSAFLLMMPRVMKLFPEWSGYRALRNVFDECRAKFEKTLGEHKRDFREGELNDFIDVYLAEMKKSESDPQSFFHGDMAERQLVATLFDLFFAGNDTTASTLDWAILYLCKYPHVQKRLQQEITEITGDNRMVHITDRPNMPYSLALVDEILRFSTITPGGLPHLVLADTAFRGYFIPKNASIQPNHYLIHHSPKIWQDPDIFRPERFLSEDGSKYVNNENLQAFQPGRRQCVGETLARDTIYLYITNLFQQFSMEFDPKMAKEPGLEPEPGFVLAPLPYSVVMTNRLQT